jgi:hypothetical protein
MQTSVSELTTISDITFNKTIYNNTEVQILTQMIMESKYCLLEYDAM